MKIVVLDFTDGEIKIVENVQSDIQIDEIEELLYSKYHLKTSNIEFMMVDDLRIDTLE